MDTMRQLGRGDSFALEAETMNFFPKKTPASLALDAAFEALGALRPVIPCRPERDPRLIVLKQLEFLAQVAQGRASLVENEARLSVAATDRMLDEVRGRMDLLEIELGIDRDEDEHATSGGP